MCDHSNAILFIVLYKMVVTFKSVNKTLFIILYKVVLPFNRMNETIHIKSLKVMQLTTYFSSSN